MATVFMKWLETTPGAYDRGIQLLTLGRLQPLKERIAADYIQLEGQTDVSVLEIGCGTGALSLLMAERGAHVTAIDASPGMLAEAERKATEAGLTEAVEFHHLDVTKLPDRFEPGSFDVVVSTLAFSEFPPEVQRYALREAAQLLKPGGRLLIVDEIQSGLGRTGRMFACEYDDVTPDVICLAKALGGGVMPIGAFITTDDIWDKAYGGMTKCTLHTSTFGGNTRACAAGIATIQVLVEEKLPEAAAEKGKYLMEKLEALKEKHKMIKEIRGRGLIIGVEFEEPTSGVMKKLSLGVVNALSKEYLAALVMGELVNKHRVITAYTLNNPNVIRLEPPLNISYEDIDYALSSLDDVLGKFKGFTGAAISSAGTMISSVFKKKDK